MTTDLKHVDETIDWSLTTWEGAAREQQRRWTALPLESVILAQEEMRELSEWLGGGAAKR